jgi:hypothetical protein
MMIDEIRVWRVALLRFSWCLVPLVVLDQCASGHVEGHSSGTTSGTRSRSRS